MHAYFNKLILQDRVTFDFVEINALSIYIVLVSVLFKHPERPVWLFLYEITLVGH